MKRFLVLLIVFVCSFQTSQAQIGRLPLSPLQESTIKIGHTAISIAYSRPSKKGREIFGGLVPYDQWWRTGANENTTIEFSEDVMVGGQRLASGKYAIFSKPGRQEWEIVFYEKVDNWNVPEKIDPESIAASVVVKSMKTERALEALSIAFGDFTNYQFDLHIAWDQTQVIVPIGLITAEIMEEKIAQTLNGPVPHDYYSAALYEMESGGNFERGLKWIDTAIEMRENLSWWDLRVKAILMIELNRQKEAEKLAEKALEMAQAENHEYGIREMTRVLKSSRK